jgi:hypothetical protein
MEKIEITIKCNEDDFDMLAENIMDGLKRCGECPFLYSDKPSYCGEDADCERCIEENIDIGSEC